MNTVACDGVISQVAGNLTCSTTWLEVPYSTPFDPSQIDPNILGAMFGAGFVIITPIWGVAFGFRKI